MDLSMSKIPDRWRSRRNAKRADRLDAENDRLRAELRLVTSQLEDVHGQQVIAKPRGGVLRLILVGAAAYIFGMRARREASERTRAGVSSIEHRRTGAPDDVDTSSPGIGPRPNPLTESGIRPRRYGSVDANARRSA